MNQIYRRVRNASGKKKWVVAFCLSSMVFITPAQNVFDILIPVDCESKLIQLSESGNVPEQLEALAKSIKKENYFDNIKSAVKEQLNRKIFYIHNGTTYKLLLGQVALV